MIRLCLLLHPCIDSSFFTEYKFLPKEASKRAFISFRETKLELPRDLHVVPYSTASVTNDIKHLWLQICFLQCICNCQSLSLAPSFLLCVRPLFCSLSVSLVLTQISWQIISCFLATLNWPHCQRKTMFQFSNVSGICFLQSPVERTRG